MTPNDLADALSDEAMLASKRAAVLRALDYSDEAAILRDTVADELDRQSVRLMRMFAMALPDDPIAEPAISGDMQEDGSLAIKHGLFLCEVDFGDEGKGMFIRLSDFNKVVRKLESVRQDAVDAQPQPQCGCGLDTCKESWEPGCGLGTSIEHAVPVDAPIPDGEAGWVVGQGMPQRQGRAVDADVLHRMNGDLCQFAKQWEIDGDYMRCRDCRRNQCASYAANEFQHAPDCKAGQQVPRPWETFIGLLSPIYTEQPASAAVADGIPDAWIERVRTLERAFNNIYHMDEAAGGNLTAQEALNLAKREGYLGEQAAAELRKMIAVAKALAAAPDRSQSGGGS